MRRPPPAARRGLRSRPRSERGAVLIVALLLAALIAVGLASYLNLNLSSSRLAERSFRSYGALNLAEAGAEEAVWSFNRHSGGAADAWSGWSTSAGSNAAWQRFSGFEFGRNTQGWVQVYVDNHRPGPTARPRVLTLATIGPPGGSAVTRMLEVSLRRRSAFAGGLVAKERIVFSGQQTSVDAWNSDPDGDPSTAAVAYATEHRTDRGSIASRATYTGSVLINHADVWGTVSTGGAAPEVGTNGRIRGQDTPADVMIDPRRITTDFNAAFPAVLAPADGTPLASIPPVLGTAGSATRWRSQSLTLSGNETLTILGDVTLVLTAGAGATALSVTGNASIIIPEGSRLVLFVQGNVHLAGNGLANQNPQPGTFQLWGTNDTVGGQSILLAGNGALKGAIYAPEGDVSIVGNGDVMGAIVGRSIQLTGNATFHYDEALAEGHGNEPFTIGRWREITDENDRAAVRALFEGW